MYFFIVPSSTKVLQRLPAGTLVAPSHTHTNVSSIYIYIFVCVYILCICDFLFH